jgi:sugar phosphate isomerase/epimerase
LDAVIAAAREYGYDGLEFRGIGDALELTIAPEFAPAGLAETRQRLADAGVAAVCLSSSVRAVSSTLDEADRHTAVAQAERYIDLAHALDAPFVRVFLGDPPAALLRAEAVARAAEMLRAMGAYAEPRGVMVLVETHDAFVRSEELEALLRAVRHPSVRILWDIHHPFRYADESVAHTLRYLGSHIRAVHVKDGTRMPDGTHVTYTMLGEGDVPVREALTALHAHGYDGWVTVEWEKRWHPGIADAAVALPQYAKVLRSWLTTM